MICGRCWLFAAVLDSNSGATGYSCWRRSRRRPFLCSSILLDVAGFLSCCCYGTGFDGLLDFWSAGLQDRWILLIHTLDFSVSLLRDVLGLYVVVLEFNYGAPGYLCRWSMDADYPVHCSMRWLSLYSLLLDSAVSHLLLDEPVGFLLLVFLPYIVYILLTWVLNRTR